MCMNIALTNLGQYNEGILNFTWLELPATDEEIAAAFDKIQVSHDDTHYYSDGRGSVVEYGSPEMVGEYEEFFITDYECDFYRVGEYENIETLNDIAEQIDSLDNYEKDIVKGLMSEGYSLEDAIDNADDVIVYSGCYTMTDVAYEYIEECCSFEGVPDWITNYFDYEAYGRDMSFDGHWFELEDGSLAVLWS